MHGSTREPLVSIVLPTYNGARYIGETIQSCLGQTYRNLELVIVDDGSTDGSTVAAVERSLKHDGRVRLLRHDRNRNLPAALNTGFRNAAGSYLTWIADDNTFRVEAIQEMVGYLETHPAVDVVYTDCTLTDAEGRPYARMEAGEPERLWSTDFNCVGPCFLYRRRVQDALGGYAEEMFLVEDYDFWLRASLSFCLSCYHRDLFYYRRHGESLSARFNPRIERLLDRVLARHLPAAPMAATAKAAVFFMLAQRARSRGEALSTVTCLASSWVHSPRVFAQYLGRAAQKRVWRRFGTQ